jgi:hypothetical protein
MSRKFTFGGSYASAPSYGALTTAWIAITSESNTTIINALNNLETALNSYGLISKLIALYPFVGGTDLKHSYNFKNTALYQLAFSGGWTHNSLGIIGNGVNTFANTGIIASSTQTINGGGFGVYNRTNNAGAYYDFQNGTSNELLALKFSDNNLYANAGSVVYTPIFNPDPRGLWLTDWDGSNINTYRNGVLFQNIVKSVTSLQSTQYAISANFNPSNRNYAMAYALNDDLTPTEHANFYTAVQAFQTTLSRNV